MFAVSRGFSSDVGCAGGNAHRALWLRLLCHGQWPSLVCCLVWAIPLNWRPCTPLPGWRSRAPRGSSKASAGGALPLPLPASPAGGPALWLHLPGSGPQITWPSKTSCTQISVCLLLIQTFVTPFQAYLEKTNSLSTSRFCPSSLVQSRFCHIREYLVSSDCDLDFLGAITQLTTASKRPPGGPLPPIGPLLAHKKQADIAHQSCRTGRVFPAELSLLCHHWLLQWQDFDIFSS